MTIEQERDIAVLALNEIHAGTWSPTGVVTTALADIAAIAAQASPVAQDERSQWKCGNEYAPYHPSASHVDPQYREGWNACYQAGRASVAVPSMTVDDITHEFTLDTIVSGLQGYSDHDVSVWRAELDEYIRVACNKAMPAAQPVGDTLTFDQIEDAFQEGGTASCDECGYIKTSAQWLHDFARNVYAIKAQPVGEAVAWSCKYPNCTCIGGTTSTCAADEI